MKLQPHSLLLTGILVLTAPLAANAATIVSDGSAIGVNAITSGGPNSVEYDFFGATSNLGNAYFNLPNLSTLTYATYTPAAPNTNTFTYGGYSQININGTPYQTGVYNSGQVITSETTMGTITFNSSVPSTFRLGIFTDNFDNSLNNTSYSVSVTGDATAVVIPSSGNTTSNDFFYLQLSGVTQGDIITINATSGFEPEIGGITFDVPATPEPSTYAMLGLGVLTFALLKLRRRLAQSASL